MAKLTFAGHPVHPQIIPLPAGLLPFSFALDLLHLITGKRAYADAAYYSMMGGSLGAVAAGAAGAMDYLEIKEDTPVKQSANTHAALNTGMLALYGVNLLLRRGRRSPGVVPVLLSALGTAGIAVSSWYGGHMVYEHGMRVKRLSPTNDEDAMRPRFDRRLEEALTRGEEIAPARGPVSARAREATVRP